ncbi:MAG: hypothetical protein ACK58N_10425 [Synechocystis sp.]|jgi:hypothetical protein
MSADTNLDERLLKLIQETCEKPPNTPARQRGLNKLVFLIQKSGKIYYNHQLSQVDYEDALQKTWLYFCRNLCEAITAKNSYDANQGSILTWLNAYLKQRIKDAYLANQAQMAMTDLSPLDSGENARNPIENLPSPNYLTNNADQILQKIQQWLQSEKKRLRRIHIRDRAEINAHLLILRRLPPESTTWQALAQEWNIPPSTLANFYQRRCLPLLRELQHQL